MPVNWRPMGVHHDAAPGIKPKFVGWDGIVPGCRADGFNKPLWAFKYCAPTPPEGARWVPNATSMCGTNIDLGNDSVL